MEALLNLARIDLGNKEKDRAVALYKELKEKGVKLVRVVMVTVVYVRRIKVIPLEEFFSSCVSGGVTLPIPLMHLPYYGDVLVEGSCPSVSGDYICLPDLDTVKQLPHCPKQAFALVNMINKQSHQLPTICPRTMLQRVVSRAKEEFGIDLMVGFETEFIILKDFDNCGEKFVPLDDHLFGESHGTYRISSFFEQVHETLADLGVQVLAMHCEAGVGMFEVVTGPGDPVTSVDKLVLTREVLSELAAQRGWKLTLCPKIYDDRAGTGQHVHMSIWKQGRNLVPDDSTDSQYSIGESAQQFIAGIVEHLGGLALVLTPTVNSFRRMKLHFLSGAFRGWAHENKAAAVRLCEGLQRAEGVRHCTNFEIKCVDGTCNPYYAVSGLISAGLDGLRRKLPIPPPLHIEHGNHDLPLMPLSFEEAEKLYQEDSVIRELFADSADRLLLLHRAEQLYFKDKSPEFVKRATIEHY